jgi:nucleotide-binding universal stress UspA family protein
MSIVVAYVPDEHGRAALEHGAAEAHLRGERLVVVNATKGDAYVDNRFTHSDEIEQLEQRLSEQGVEHEVRQLVARDVTEAVLGVVAEVGAGLLVVGTRRRTPVGKMLLGSTAQQLILACPCPVLAVKAGIPPG